MILESEAQVAGILLAAGGSTRMGKLKQLLPLGGRPMVSHAASALCKASLAQVVVVLGAQADEVQRALGELPVEFVINEAWTEGISTSLRAGMRALRPEIEAALIALADQPGLTPALLRAIVARYRETRAAILAPFYQGRRGNPVLFDRVMFSELLQIRGDEGGRELLARYGDRLERLDTDDSAAVLDVDTPYDYAQARQWHHDLEAEP
jgi:molybdenum cofactor cytidylyltransferase